MKRLVAFAVGLTIGLALCGCTRKKHAVVVISNERSGDLTVIDPDTDTVTKTIPVGKRPRGMKASPDGKLVYVAVTGSTRDGPRDTAADGIAVVDLERGVVLRRLGCGRDPEAFDVTPDGKRLFVSNEETAEVSEVDIASDSVVRRIPVGKEPEGVTIADGEIFVTSEAESRVDVISDAEHRVVRSIPTPARPRAIAVRGGEAFVTAENAGSLAVLDTHGGLKETLALGPGARPMGIAVAGNEAFVSNGRGKSVAVVDMRRHSILGTIRDVGPRVWGLAATEKKLYAAAGSDVAVIDIEQRAVLRHLRAGDGVWGVIVVTPDVTGSSRNR